MVRLFYIFSIKLYVLFVFQAGCYSVFANNWNESKDIIIVKGTKYLISLKNEQMKGIPVYNESV